MNNERENGELRGAESCDGAGADASETSAGDASSLAHAPMPARAREWRAEWRRKEPGRASGRPRHGNGGCAPDVAERDARVRRLVADLASGADPDPAALAAEWGVSTGAAGDTIAQARRILRIVTDDDRAAHRARLAGYLEHAVAACQSPRELAALADAQARILGVPTAAEVAVNVSVSRGYESLSTRDLVARLRAELTAAERLLASEESRALPAPRAEASTMPRELEVTLLEEEATPAR